jgi:hypothetical protein
MARGRHTPTQGVWTHFSVPLVEANWTHVAGTGTWADIMADVTHVGVRMRSGLGGGAVSGQLDNFALTPEPGTMAIVGLWLAGMAARRWRRQRGA